MNTSAKPNISPVELEKKCENARFFVIKSCNQENI